MELEEVRRRRLARLDPRAGEEEAERRAEEARVARLAQLGPATAAFLLRAPSAPVEPQLTHQPAVDAAAAAEPPSERVCRICHGGPELGVLFSPCRCRGTTRFVHVRCLAAWRTISVGRDSFHACDVCAYRYNTARASWAPLLELRSLQLCVASLLLLGAVAASGGACQLLGVGAALKFYQLVLWLPPWYGGWLSELPLFDVSLRTARVLDALVAGVAVCGTLGTFAAMKRRYQLDPVSFWQTVGPSVMTAFLSAGTPALRIFVSGGIVYGFTQLAVLTAGAARGVLSRFGEVVLDVSETHAHSE